MDRLVNKVFIDANVLVKGGTFLAKSVVMYASDDCKEDSSILELPNGKEVLEVVDSFGSPYVDYFISGGFTIADGGGKITPDILSDDLFSRTLKGLSEIRELLSIEIPVSTLHQLFYREQNMAVAAEFENFLFCLILREMIFNKEALLNNVRTYNYDENLLGLKKHINKTDIELFEFIKERATKLVYHNFDKVNHLFEIVFRKDISVFLEKVQTKMSKRHNIVHRNGKKLNGELDFISKEEVTIFLNDVEDAVKNIWTLTKP